MSHLTMERKMNDKYINTIKKALTEIVGLNKLGYDFEIKRGKYHIEPLGSFSKYIDGFWVSIDYDFWNDEKHKKNTFDKLAKVFPDITYLDDDDFAHIPFGYDNFPSN